MRITISWVRFKENLPWLRKLAADAKTVAVAVLSGKQVNINVFVTQEQYLREYREVIEVRQSKRSTRRWAYIPGRIPPGDYVMTLKRPR